ncbi:DUF7504 family protein [Halegenticoccus tardaugens]|uniref:DUF7504 family protein n=1 Tax=Halegenticoccus tardaugens TaxID=2071624 RepID=UPI00100BD465|nr:hypothetical protein [Halegenticoccus tardaugens]
MWTESTFRDAEEGVTLGAVLSRLKRNGCNLLVTGAVAETASARATRRLLGSPTEHRERIIVLTDSSRDLLDERLPAGVTLDHPHVRLVDRRGGERSCVRKGSGADPAAGDDSLAHLQRQLVRFVGELDHESLSPATLRLSLDSLSAVLERYDEETVVRFLRVVTALVRGARGMGHFHLPLPDDDPQVRSLAPLFDARVELRRRGSMQPEQRWHVPEYGVTEWVGI